MAHKQQQHLKIPRVSKQLLQRSKKEITSEVQVMEIILKVRSLIYKNQMHIPNLFTFILKEQLTYITQKTAHSENH